MMNARRSPRIAGRDDRAPSNSRHTKTDGRIETMYTRGTEGELFSMVLCFQEITGGGQKRVNRSNVEMVLNDV
jgi:hypothetical protein